MIVCLYDVHGNLPALEAVLAHAGAADRYVLGGDYALFGGRPAETVARLRELEPAIWIRGNCERLTADIESAPEHARAPLEASRAALGDDLVEELAALPETAQDGDTLICHGSPAGDSRSFMPEPEGDEPELLAGVTARRLLFGHTHLAFWRVADGVELVNPGAVGMPLDGDNRAAYAVIRDDGEIEHRRVEYDHEAAAAEVRERFGGWAETVARRIAAARFDV
jgi:predicted phosphodiesterase